MARRSLLETTAVKLGRRPRTDAKRHIPVEMEPQQEPNWCWAAVTCSVARFYDSTSPWKQCALANAELGQTTCCDDGGSDACNRPWVLDAPLTRVGHLQKAVANAVGFDAVVGEIDASRPLCARIAWSDGVSAHFVVLSGYSQDVQFVDVDDPANGPSTTTYTGFRDAYRGSGTWTHSYLTE